MPFYSDPGYYYGGGGYQLYSPYYTSTPYTSSYSGYGRSLGSSYVIPPPRVNLSSSRYKPKLSTISETPYGRSGGVLPLTRIHSPKISYHSSPSFKPPRPISINTADIDVSASRFRKRERSEESDESTSARRHTSNQEDSSDCNNNNVEEGSPFMPRIDGNDPMPNHRSTIKRDRPLVRLSIMRKRSKGSQKGLKDSKRSSSKKSKSKKNQEEEEEEKQEKVSWRDRFGDDLIQKRKGSPRKSPGELLRERYLIKDKESEDQEMKEIDLSQSLVLEENPEGNLEINVEQTLRRLSLPKAPSFHEICQDISSDKIDDDLNAGVLRRRASLIQEQEAEIINQLQKSNSGTLQFIIERSESQGDCRKSVKRKSKKGKKLRTKITATVQIDNPPLTPIIQELQEDSEANPSPVEPKLKASVEEIEENHTIHHVVKLPKKREKTENETSNLKTEGHKVDLIDTKKGENDISKIVINENFNKTSKIPQNKEELTSIQDKSENINKASETVSAPKIEKVKENSALDKLSETKKEITSIKPSDPVPKPQQETKTTKPNDKTEIQSPTDFWATSSNDSKASTPAVTTPKFAEPAVDIKPEKSVQSPSVAKTPNLQFSKSAGTLLEKKATKPEYFTFDVDNVKAHTLDKTASPEVGTPKISAKLPQTPKICQLKQTSRQPQTPLKSPQTPQTPKTPGALKKTTPGIAKPKPIAKMQKSDSGEDFWAQIGSRETLYMNKRKKILLEQQWEKRESLLEDQEVIDSNEESFLSEMKQKIGTQKVEALKNADQVNSKKSEMKRSESTESVLKDESNDTSKDAAKKEQIQTQENCDKISQAKIQERPIEEKKYENNVNIKIKKSESPKKKVDVVTQSTSEKVLKSANEKEVSVLDGTKTAEETPPKRPQAVTTKSIDSGVPKIAAGTKAKSPEVGKNENNKTFVIPSGEENARGAVKKVSPKSKTAARQSSQDRKEEEKSANVSKTESAAVLKRNDATQVASEESGRKGVSVGEKAKVSSDVDQQTGDKIRTKEIGSSKEDKKQIEPENPVEGLFAQKTKLSEAPISAPALEQNDVKRKITPKRKENENSHAADKNEKIVGGGIRDAGEPKKTVKDDLDSRVPSACKLSKFATVSDLNRCLLDVDADISDYNPSGEESSYDSSDDDGDSMKKKNRDKKKEEKFNPNKVIKLDHKKKCYVKEEAPPYPLIATPRPLWKREKFNYPSDSESEESESDSECSTTDDSSDELNPNKDNIIRMSTCSSDSGFEGGTAPSSPKKMLGK